jgi:hypothetical protein
MISRVHPDSHEFDDWQLYSPRDPAILGLVNKLAYENGMRLVEIKAIIEQALRAKLAKFDANRAGDSDQSL